MAVAVCFLEVVVGWECSWRTPSCVSFLVLMLFCKEEVVTAENVNAHLHGRPPLGTCTNPRTRGWLGGPIDEGTAESLLGKDDGMD